MRKIVAMATSAPPSKTMEPGSGTAVRIWDEVTMVLDGVVAVPAPKATLISWSKAKGPPSVVIMPMVWFDEVTTGGPVSVMVGFAGACPGAG